MADDQPEPKGVRAELAALRSELNFIAKGLLRVDTALEDWEGERAVPAGQAGGVTFPGPEA